MFVGNSYATLGGIHMYYLSGWAERLKFYSIQRRGVIKQLNNNLYQLDERYGQLIRDRAGCNGGLTVGTITRTQTQYENCCYSYCGIKGHVLLFQRKC